MRILLVLRVRVPTQERILLERVHRLMLRVVLLQQRMLLERVHRPMLRVVLLLRIQVLRVVVRGADAPLNLPIRVKRDNVSESCQQLGRDERARQSEQHNDLVVLFSHVVQLVGLWNRVTVS